MSDKKREKEGAKKFKESWAQLEQKRLARALEASRNVNSADSQKETKANVS
jgi:hypothetical protein